MPTEGIVVKDRSVADTRTTEDNNIASILEGCEDATPESIITADKPYAIAVAEGKIKKAMLNYLRKREPMPEDVVVAYDLNLSGGFRVTTRGHSGCGRNQ